MTDAAFLPVEQIPPTRNSSQSSDEALFRTLGDATPGFMWIVDAEGRFVYTNRTWEEYTGSTLDELNQVGWERFNHPDEIEEVRRQWGEAIAQGRRFEMELRYKRHDGENRWMLARVVTLIDY